MPRGHRVAAEKAVGRRPVYITDRGDPASVMLNFAAYEELLGGHRVLDLLAEPAGVEDFAASPSPSSAKPAEPARFD